MKVLSADIGGTNARFALANLTPEGAVWLNRRVFSSQEASFEEALREIIRTRDGIDDVRTVVIAAAGPVENGRVQMTNAAFSVDVRLVKNLFQSARVLLVNDFQAQAWGLDFPGIENSLEVLCEEGPAFCSPVRTVIGAGTGFGTGWLLTGESSAVIASELGHIPMTFTSAEREIERFYQSIYPDTPLTVEHVLSGRGLTLLNVYYTGSESEPALFTHDAGFDASDTCATFARFYGRAARTAALAVLTQSLVIGGGIARKSPCLVKHPNFLAEFLNYRGPHLNYLKRIRLFLDTTGDLGLFGTLALARKTV